MAANFEHTYQFYMMNGEHILIDADRMNVLDDCILLYIKEADMPFMQVFKSHLMAWEAVR